MNDMILILNYSDEFAVEAAKRLRGERVFCKIISGTTTAAQVAEIAPRGLVLCGEPKSAAGVFDAEILKLDIPVLALGHAAHMLIAAMGGACAGAAISEKKANVQYADCKLFTGVEGGERYIQEAVTLMLPADVQVTAGAGGCTIAFADDRRSLFGIQFELERNDPDGSTILKNFARDICGCMPWFTMDAALAEARRMLADASIEGGFAVCGVSGGVDSSVVAALLIKAIGKQLTCVFVDHGLLRKNEKEEVCSVFGPGNANGFDINFICVDARDRYFAKLAGVTEPERKRKIIGEEFIRVFEEQAKQIGKVDFLAQGTIYPDVVESGLGGESTVIKSHHNVGGLPDTVDFKELVEPLRNLFKDEVRQAGRELGLPEYLVSRQPFPGPGLGIRIIGEVTPEKVAIVQDADAIWREEIAKAGLDKEISQYYAALTNMHSVGVMGDERTYDYAVALRAVTTTDFMTAESYNMPWDVLGTVTSRIVNEVKHVNRVFYDCTGKPPATIELE